MSAGGPQEAKSPFPYSLLVVEKVTYLSSVAAVRVATTLLIRIRVLPLAHPSPALPQRGSHLLRGARAVQRRSFGDWRGGGGGEDRTSRGAVGTLASLPVRDLSALGLGLRDLERLVVCLHGVLERGGLKVEGQWKKGVERDRWQSRVRGRPWSRVASLVLSSCARGAAGRVPEPGVVVERKARVVLVDATRIFFFSSPAPTRLLPTLEQVSVVLRQAAIRQTLIRSPAEFRILRAFRRINTVRVCAPHRLCSFSRLVLPLRSLRFPFKVSRFSL